MDITLVAGIMGLVGALVGGYGSYLGGENGAEKSYALMIKHQDYLSKRRIISLLDVTLSAVLTILDNESKFEETLIDINGIIYDPEWPKALALINDIQPGEVVFIVYWLRDVESFQINSNNPDKSKNCFMRTFKQQRIDGVERIIKKLEAS